MNTNTNELSQNRSERMNTQETRIPEPFMNRNVVIYSTMSREEACSLIQVLSSEIAKGNDEIPIHIRTDRQYSRDDLITRVSISTGSIFRSADAIVTDHFVSNPFPLQTWPS